MPDRNQLIGFLDRYEQALAARDPARLPVSPDVRFTENGQVLEYGSWGHWATISSIAGRHADFADPVTGHAAFFAVIEEHGVQSILAARLKIEHERVTEIESLVVRERESLFKPPGWVGPSRVFRSVPPERKASRAEMERIANRYFDGIEQDDGSIIPVTGDCMRVENGLETVGPEGESSSASMGFNLGRMGVANQISTGYFKYINRIRDRRYPIFDEEQGIVFGIVLFDHSGLYRSVELKGGLGRIDYPPFARRPSSALIWEAFQIESGLIRGIEAALDFFPFGMKSGW